MEQYRDCLGPWSSVLPLKAFPKTVPLGGGSQWCLASPLQQEPQTCLIRGCRGGFCGFLGTDMLKHYFSGDTQLRRAFLTFSHSPKNTSLNTRQPFNHHFYLGCCSSMKVEAGLSGTDLRCSPLTLHRAVTRLELCSEGCFVPYNISLLLPCLLQEGSSLLH